MRKFVITAAAAAFSISFAGSAAAQDAAMQGHDMGGASGTTLPEICQTSAEAPAMSGMEDMEAAMQDMNESQTAMMQGMMQTHGPMMQGMMAEDTDIAFACAMIPHHLGAISMAEVELQHGDSEEMQELARRVIEDQRAEIAELTQWLEAQEAQ